MMRHSKVKKCFQLHLFLLLSIMQPLYGDDQKSADHEKLIGTWKIVSMEIDGETQHPNGIGFYVIRENKISLTNGMDEYEVSYSIDSSKTPKEIDQVWDHDGVQAASQGIYSLDGDTLRICGALNSSKPRPQKFVTSEGDGFVIYTLKREKDVDKPTAPEANQPNVKALKELGAQFDLDTEGRIQTVMLSFKRVTDSDLSNLIELKHLDSLSLMATGVTDAGLETVGKLQQLKRLNLSVTKISSAGLDHLVHLNNLEEIALLGTPIDKIGILKLKQLPKLREIALLPQQFTKSEIEELKQSMPNCTFVFSEQ